MLAVVTVVDISRWFCRKREPARSTSRRLYRSAVVAKQDHVGTRQRALGVATPARRRAAAAASSSTMITMAGWTSISSTVDHRIFTLPKTPIQNALYRNNGDGTFTDVTDKAGVAAGRWVTSEWARPRRITTATAGRICMSPTTGRNMLFHNNGNGTFTNVTDKAGVAAPNWSTCADWFDYDNDSKLDLFVSSFVQYSGKSARSSAAITASAVVTIAFRACSNRVRVFCFTTKAAASSCDVSTESGIACAARQIIWRGGD